MKELTKEQRAKLAPMEHHLQTAITGNYVRTVTRHDAEIMNQIHIQLGLGGKNLSCGKCVLELCKNLGRLYFN